MPREHQPKIDTDASADIHLQALRAEGQAYIARALKQNLPAPTRQRILSAALRYLEWRARHATTSQHFSQVPSQQLSQATHPTSAFQTLLASLLDEAISPHALIDACARAADAHLTPILVKSLFVLSAIGPITDHKALTVIRSQTQPEEEDLFRDENCDPQRPSQLQHNQVAVRRTGQSFVDEFVSRLADAPRATQARSSAVFVAAVAREAPLSDGAAQNVLQLLTYRMPAVQLLELPPFLYQLLLFASVRGTPVAKSRVLLHIADVFSQREATARRTEALSQSLLADDEDAITPATSLSSLRQVQGTALVHIEYAVKQDPSLSAELVKLAKAGIETPRHFLTSFGMGIILSLSRAASVQTDVLAMLREVIQRFSRERRLRASNLYVARVSMNDDPLLNLPKSLSHIAESTCETGWDYVKESLLKFAFVLLDKPLPRAPEDPTAAGLAESLIFTLFNTHSSMRECILEQLTMRIALQEQSALQAIAIIRKLADTIPFYVLEHNRFIRDGIELLATLPPWMAATLMEAYRPLLAARRDLLDYFQLVVRKSLFHRDTSSRAVAINGFLTAVSLCSSGSVGGRDGGSPDRCGHSCRKNETEVNVIVEAIQPLRRIFSYTAALKAYWYKHAILHVQRIESDHVARCVATSTVEVLRGHLLRFVDATKAPYVLVEHCVDESADGRLVEPLGDLIWCLAVHEARRDPVTYTTSFIMDLARKLSSVSLQDFAFAKETMTESGESRRDNNDFEEGNGADERTGARANRNKARTLGAVAEALIHAVLIIPHERQDWRHYSEIAIPMLVLKGKLFDLLRKAGMASAFDAFSDLGGDIGIERIRPGMRMLLQRSGKSSGSSKKGGASRKSKNNDGNNNTVAAAAAQGPNHRFGVFNVLCSTASRPTLSLKVTVQVLQKMSVSADSLDANDSNPFKDHCNSLDFQELRVYLLAVAHKHVEDFVASLSRAAQGDYLESESATELLNLTKVLAKIAMNDFKRFRRSSPQVAGQGGLKALQLADLCACTTKYLAKSERRIMVSFCHAMMPMSTSTEEHDEDAVFEMASKALERLISTLLDDAMMKEVAVALHIHDSVVAMVLPTCESVEEKAAYLDKRVSWASNVLVEREIRDSGVVKTLVRICLLYTENNNDLRRALEICRRLLKVMGDCDENAEPPEAGNGANGMLSNATAIEQDTSLATVDAVLDVIERGVSDVEWCLGRMSSLEAASNGECSLGSEPNQLDKREPAVKETRILEATAKQAIRAEDAAQLRLEGIVRTLGGLAKCAIGKWAQQERLLKLITKTYKALCSATQAQAKRRGDPRTSFVSLINECKGLAPTLWTYLAFVGADAVEEGRRKGASKATREARVMPQLVYEVERFEKVLIAAQKRTRISLLRGMRRNIARDFRIREDRLQDEDDSKVANGENEVSEEMPRVGLKRRRRS